MDAVAVLRDYTLWKHKEVIGLDAVAVLQEKFAVKEITPEKYRTMGSLMMRFHLEQYAVEGLGNLCVLKTRAMLGLMNLLTVVVTPSSGKNVPFLLIDTMDMGKKHLCYVEYYDCTAGGADKDKLLAASAPYGDVADYAEKPAWYVQERMAGSLIKRGTPPPPPSPRPWVRRGPRPFFGPWSCRCKAARENMSGSGRRWSSRFSDNPLHFCELFPIGWPVKPERAMMVIWK